MKYALFLGCTIPARSRNYEMSARRVAEKLDIGLVDLPEFICCGFPIRASEQGSAETAAAFNLALAERAGLDLLTLCSSCASALTETAHQLKEDRHAMEEVNEALSRVGLEYRGRVRVRHMARVLKEEVGVDT